MFMKNMKRDYSMAIEKRDFAKIDKLYDVIEDETTTKANYWDKVRKLTKRVTSDHSIGRWQCLAEYFEKFVVNEGTKINAYRKNDDEERIYVDTFYCEELDKATDMFCKKYGYDYVVGFHWKGFKKPCVLRKNGVEENFVFVIEK